jgi:valyl-tRNA synthetase
MFFFLLFFRLAYTVQGRDINLDISRVVSYRQFCNKLWNATRFALMHLTDDKFKVPHLLDLIDELANSTQLAPRDKWILSRLTATVNEVTKQLNDHQYGLAANSLYSFWLYDFCDYYLELIKPIMFGAVAAASHAGGDVATAQRLARGILYLCLDHGLKLLHPFMPFVTEELWHRLPGRGIPWRASGTPADPPSIMISAWPKLPASLQNDAVEATFSTFQAIVRSGRVLRGDADIPPSKEATFFVVSDQNIAAKSHLDDLSTLLKSPTIRIVPSTETIEDGCSVSTVDEGITLHLLLKGLVDPAQEIEKINKRQANIEKGMDRIVAKMSLASYMEKVPADVRATDAENVASFKAQLAVLHSLRAKYEDWLKAGSKA